MSNLDREAVERFQRGEIENGAAVGGLPPGYIEGFRPVLLKNLTVQVGGGVTSVQGQRVDMQTQIINRQMWNSPYTGGDSGFFYYVYLTREGSYKVDFTRPAYSDTEFYYAHPAFGWRVILRLWVDTDEKIKFVSREFNDTARVVTVAPDGYIGEADYYCDGENDQIWIAAAFDYADEIRMLPGTFVLGDDLRIDDGNRVWRGAKATINPLLGQIYINDAANPIIENILIADLIFDSSAIGANRRIYLEDVRHIAFEGCTFKNYNVYLADETSEIFFFSMRNCLLSECVVQLNGGVKSRSDFISIVDNRLVDSSINLPVEGVSSLVISDNQFENDNIAACLIQILGDVTSSPNKVYITNNTITGTPTYAHLGITVRDCSATITGNRLDYGEGISVDSDEGDYLVVTDNEVTNETTYKFQLTGTDYTLGSYSGNNWQSTSVVTDITSNTTLTPADSGTVFVDPSGGAFTLTLDSPVDVEGLPINIKVRHSNALIDRADCESTDPPAVSGETSVTTNNATFARDSGQARNGTYSYKLTKSGASCRVSLADNETTSDQHGLVDSETYTLGMWVYVPSTGGPLASEVTLEFDHYVSSWVNLGSATVTAQDEWQWVTVTVTLTSSTTGVRFGPRIADAAANTEFIYVDDIQLYRHYDVTIAAPSGASIGGSDTWVLAAEGDYLNITSDGQNYLTDDYGFGWTRDFDNLDLPNSFLLEAGSGIIEQGTNSNGSYVIFSSGLQVCWLIDTGVDDCNNASGNVYRTDSNVWTYPAVFSAAPTTMAIGNGGSQIWGACGTPTTTACSFRLYAQVARTGDNAGLIAIGFAA